MTTFLDTIRRLSLLRLDHARDPRLLEAWRAAPLVYQPGQPIDSSWHRDDYDIPLLPDPDGAVFERASDLLLRYRFYPMNVLRHSSDFVSENRRMRVGDRIIQRILIVPPILDLLTMNEVTQVWDEPDKAGLTYITTERHDEMGEWSAWVERRADQLHLRIQATSRPRPHMPGILYPYGRWLQRRAHRLGIERFKQVLLTSHQ